MEVADEAGERGRGEPADAGHRAQARDEWCLAADRLEPELDPVDAPFALADFGDELEGGEAQRVAQAAVGVAGELEGLGVPLGYFDGPSMCGCVASDPVAAVSSVD